MWLPKENSPPLRDGSDTLSVDVLGYFSNGRMMFLNYDALKGWVAAEEGFPIFSDRLMFWAIIPEPPNSAENVDGG